MIKSFSKNSLVQNVHLGGETTRSMVSQLRSRGSARGGIGDHQSKLSEKGQRWWNLLTKVRTVCNYFIGL